MDPLLSIEKPVRYSGEEWNAVTSKPDAKLNFIFAYPDVYEVGMSFLGLQIIYGLLNEQDWIWCERTFCPWPDREKQLRETNELLGTHETNRALKDAHIVGFSLQHEMMYTNVLTMLELGGLAIERWERNEKDPIVIAGGPCTYNPMPMADFIDAFVIGEGEEVAVEVCECVERMRSENASRDEILHAIGRIEGMYIPSLYEEEINRRGEVVLSKPKYDDVPAEVIKRLIMDFENSYYPTKQVVPNTKVIHHRLALEVLRGCPGGCRFCQAGYIDRPVRERSPERLRRDAKEGLQNTGLNEIGLLSLSTADHTKLPEVCSGMIQEFGPQRVSISLPSLRIDSFPARVTQEIGKVRSTGLTFAPEAGTERLRWAINKLIYDAEIYAKVRASVTEGQTQIKFYFMLGLPTETDDDLQGIVDMVLNVKAILKEIGRNRTNIHVGLSPFVPKPHTAYQWYGQITLDEVEYKVNFVRKQLGHVKGVKVNWHDPQKSTVEGAVARGDVRIGRVIRTVYNNGGRFDEWGEHFNYQSWVDAYAEHGLSIEDYATKTYGQYDLLPWDPISIRISKRYLWREWEKTMRAAESRHCGNEMCRVCKICDGSEVKTIHAPDSDFMPKSKYNMEHDLVPEITSTALGSNDEKKTWRYRLRFSKTGTLAYASHHDLMMMMETLFRRADIRMAFSEGFHPHPKIVFAHALSVGVESEGEYLDLTTTQPYKVDTLAERLNALCPNGLHFSECILLENHHKKVTAVIRAFRYRMECAIDDAAIASIQEALQHPEIRDELKLLEAGAVSSNTNRIQIEYLCHVEGGKFTKPETVSGRISEIVNQPLEIQSVMRLDMYTLSPQNRIISLTTGLERVSEPKSCKGAC